MYDPRWLLLQADTGEKPDTMIFRARPSFAKGSDLPWSVRDIEVMTTSKQFDPTTGNLTLDVASDGTHHKVTRRIVIPRSMVAALELVEANIE